MSWRLYPEPHTLPRPDDEITNDEIQQYVERKVFKGAKTGFGTVLTLDPKRCACKLLDGYASHPTQCSAPGKYKEGGHVWCGRHAPSKVIARARRTAIKRAEKYDREFRAREQQNRRQEYVRQCVEAIERIASGEANDPTGLAQMVVEGKPKSQEQ